MLMLDIQLMDENNEPVKTVQAPSGQPAIMWNQRLFVQHSDGQFRETHPFIALEPGEPVGG